MLSYGRVIMRCRVYPAAGMTAKCRRSHQVALGIAGIIGLSVPHLNCDSSLLTRIDSASNAIVTSLEIMSNTECD